MANIDVTQDANLTSNTAPALADRLMLIRNSDSVLTDITPDQLMKIIALLTAKASPTSADSIVIYDAATGLAKQVTLANLHLGQQEGIEDTVGAMVAGNTETNIAVTYDDTNGKLNFVVSAADTSTPGVSELATSAETLAGTDTTRTVTPAGLASVINNLPQGMLWNGKLSVTVASNNITVALKTLAGNDPSASDPVYVRIQDTVRTITSAKSVTKNAGTNWFNSGSAELATQEIDYFVYLGYNATDGVTIGFARIPYANRYNDFSATTTNEKYAAISTITNAAATDYYELVGRFAATLSAGASYNWSVPTFTANTLINRPIYETRWLVYTPVGSTGTGSSTFGTCAGLYKVNGSGFTAGMTLPITNTGTGSNGVRGTLPFTPGTNYAITTGRENQSTGTMLQGQVTTNFVNWLTYNNGHPGGTNYTVMGSISDVRMP